MKALKLELWDIERVLPYELNVKKHDPKQVQKIAKSITEFGWDQPIVVDKDGSIIKGHGRRLAAISLGMAQVPVLVRDDLTPDQVRAARLSDNRVAISDIDTDLLQKELASLSFDLKGIFEEKELNFVVADLGEVDFDAFVPDLDEEVRKQAAETLTKIDETDDRDVKLDKVFGFKSIKGRDERAVAIFMAQIEGETGLAGADAFIKFVSDYIEG